MSSAASIAAVSPDEAKQLGGSLLTPTGAERAGNKEGTIPAYGEQPLKFVMDSKERGYRGDPFATDKPVYSITAQNADRYASKLDGMQQLFKTYPGYRIDVYPTRRTVVYPKYFVENTLQNATECRAVQNELALQNCRGGIPFPMPKTGNEVMWNHLLAFEYPAEELNTQSHIVTALGTPILANQSTGVVVYPLNDVRNKGVAKEKEVFLKLRLDYEAPARNVGEKLVIFENLDSVNVGRRVYQYIPGQRRVKLAPNLAYDTPLPVSGGTSTMDEGRVFFGALDRYDFTLAGKKEKLIPYNTFKAQDYKTCPLDKMLTKYFPNPDCIRFELHRVWVVNAKLKPEFRHIYPARRFYWDEDSYGGVAENYNKEGELFRVVVGLQFPLGEGGGAFQGSIILYSPQNGAWSSNGLMDYPGGGIWSVPPKSDSYFSPDALSGEGIR